MPCATAPPSSCTSASAPRYLHLGEREEARAAFQLALAIFEERLRLGADDPFTRFYVAGIHALRGEPEQALSSLSRAVRMRRSFTVARARIEPEFAVPPGGPAVPGTRDGLRKSTGRG